MPLKPHLKKRKQDARRASDLKRFGSNTRHPRRMRTRARSGHIDISANHLTRWQADHKCALPAFWGGRSFVRHSDQYGSWYNLAAAPAHHSKLGELSPLE